MLRTLIIAAATLQLAVASPILAINTVDRDAIHNDTYFFDERDLDAASAAGSPNLPTGPVAGLGGCYDTTLFSINNAQGLASAIDSYIQKHSPGTGNFFNKGSYFVQAGIKNGVNPLWILAIAQHESSFGSAGIAISSGVDETGRPNIPTNNAYGRTATSQQPRIYLGDRNWYRWDSWEVSIDGEGSFLKDVYVSDPNVGPNLRAAMYKYAPNNENNTEGYIVAITGTIDEVVANAGDAVSCNNTSGEAGTTDPTAFSTRLINLANGKTLVQTLRNMRQLVVSWFIK